SSNAASGSSSCVRRWCSAPKGYDVVSYAKPSRAATAASTRSPSRTTSGPMPSPGMTAIRRVPLMVTPLAPTARSGRKVEPVLDRHPRAHRRAEARRGAEAPRLHLRHHVLEHLGREPVGVEVRKIAECGAAVLLDEHRDVQADRAGHVHP